MSQQLDTLFERLRASLPSEEELAAREAEERRALERDRLGRSGLERPFWTAPPFNDAQTEIGKHAWNLITAPQPRKGAVLMFCGHRGTGKTSLAARLIVKTITELATMAHYRKMSDLAELRVLYNEQRYLKDQMDAAMRLRRRLCGSRLMVIDEIHEAPGMTPDILVDVVDRRYAAARDTVLISNHDPEAIEQYLNPSILDRMSENGALFPCMWESFRQC